jgi:hypothetical protein
VLFVTLPNSNQWEFPRRTCFNDFRTFISFKW